MKKMKWLAVLCAASIFAGCSAQGSPTMPAGPGAGGANRAENSARAPRKGRLVLRIKIPKERKHAAGRAPKYVSPATLSMVVAIAGPTAVNQTVNLTPTSSGCTSTLTNTLCQLSVALAAGSYTATITTYDALNGAGNRLSAAQAVPFTVVAGTGNTVALTLSGVPSQILVVPGSSYAQTNAAGGIDMFGTAPNRIIVEALDADGNIISGAGSPAFVVNVAFGALAVSLTQPTAATPNAFYVTPPAAYSNRSATLSIQAAFNSAQTDGCAQPGANCFANVKVDMLQLVAGISSTAAAVYQDGQSTPFAVISPLAGVSAVAFDPAGNLYVSGGSGIAVYAPPYTSLSYALGGLANPRVLHFDHSGNLFVAQCPTCVGSGTDSVVEYLAPVSSASTVAGTIVSGIAQPSAIADDGSGNIFVANVTGNGGIGSVTQYASNGTLIATITNTVAAPNALAYDSAIPAIYVSNPGASVEAYTSPYNGAAPSGFSLPASGAPGFCGGGTVINKPVALAVNASANRIAVANSSSGTVNGVTVFRANGVSCRGVFDTGGNPAALLADGANLLYVADNLGNTLSFWAPINGAPPVNIGNASFTAPIGLATAP
jgi:hypothetical protein